MAALQSDTRLVESQAARAAVKLDSDLPFGCVEVRAFPRTRVADEAVFTAQRG